MNVIFVDPVALREDGVMHRGAYEALGVLAVAATADLVVLGRNDHSLEPVDWEAFRPKIARTMADAGLDRRVRVLDWIGAEPDRAARIKRWLAANPACDHWVTIGTAATFGERGAWPADLLAIRVDRPEELAALIGDHLNFLLLRREVAAGGAS